MKHVTPLELIYVRMKMNDCGHYNEIKTIACVRCILNNTKLLTWSIVTIQQLSYFKHDVGSDDVNVSRGVRIIVHSRFDSVDLHAGNREGNAVIICRCESASMPPAGFR